MRSARRSRRCRRRSAASSRDSGSRASSATSCRSRTCSRCRATLTCARSRRSICAGAGEKSEGAASSSFALRLSRLILLQCTTAFRIGDQRSISDFASAANFVGSRSVLAGTAPPRSASRFCHRRIVMRLGERASELVQHILRRAPSARTCRPRMLITWKSRPASFAVGTFGNASRRLPAGDRARTFSVPLATCCATLNRLLAIKVDVAAEQVVDGEVDAAIGDECRLDLRLRGEEHARHVRRRADATVRLLRRPRSSSHGR